MGGWGKLYMPGCNKAPLFVPFRMTLLPYLCFFSPSVSVSLHLSSLLSLYLSLFLSVSLFVSFSFSLYPPLSFSFIFSIVMCVYLCDSLSLTSLSVFTVSLSFFVSLSLSSLWVSISLYFGLFLCVCAHVTLSICCFPPRLATIPGFLQL